MEELIAKRYAKAFSSAKKDLKESLKLLNILSEAICDDKIQKVLASPVVPNQQKTQLLLSVLHDTSDTMLINFIKILGENKRLELIPVITKVLNADEQKASNVYQGTLKRQRSYLMKRRLHSLETTLKKYTGSNIKLIQQKSELDGMRVSVDDLGIEVNFSKQRVKEQLIDFIKKSL